MDTTTAPAQDTYTTGPLTVDSPMLGVARYRHTDTQQVVGVWDAATRTGWTLHPDTATRILAGVRIATTMDHQDAAGFAAAIAGLIAGLEGRA